MWDAFQPQIARQPFICSISCCRNAIFKPEGIPFHMLDRAPVVHREHILVLVHIPLCGDVGCLCRTRADACKHSYTKAISDAATKTIAFGGAGGRCGGGFVPVKTVVGLLWSVAEITTQSEKLGGQPCAWANGENLDRFGGYIGDLHVNNS